jgi:hypothetical protein
MNETKQHPLILVFYIDRETIKQTEIIQQFVKTVNDMIEAKEANMMAFFLPTDTVERVECINPLIATEEEKNRILELIDNIQKEFQIDKNINLNEDQND